MKKDYNKKIFVRFLSYVKPYWVLILLAALGGIIKFVLPLAFPQVMRYFIDEVLNPAYQIAPNEKARIINYYTSLVLGIYVFIWLPGTYMRHYTVGKASNRIIFDLRYELYEHIQRLSASYYKDNQSGEIVSRLINDIALAQNLIGNALTNVWIDGIIIIVLVFIMIRMNLILTVVSLAILPVYFIVTKRIGKKVKKNSKQVQKEIAKMTGFAQEKISGFAVVQAFARERHERKRFRRECIKLMDYSDTNNKLSTLNNTVTGFLTGIAPVIVVWTASRLIINERLTVGEMVVFYSYLSQFYMPLNRFAELNMVFSNSIAALERVFELFDTKPDVKENEDAVSCEDILSKDIVFNNVSFEYEENKPILKKINLTIKAGQKVAIIGTSGCGKSTLINLIPRFYDVKEGSITIGGVDVRDCKLKSLRENIGMVLQETILFSGTLRENILYANLNATEKDIVEATKAANAYDFINKLPDKFNTEVGEKGIKLSGGQKQRIAIARVFIKNPKVVILDEATSALDSESENAIQEALQRLMKGRTTIVIAHRLSTIIDADVILVMDKGEIIEMGTHDELLKREGLYKHLFEEQFKDVKAINS